MSLRTVGTSIMRILVTSAGILVCILASISPSFAETQWSVGVSGGSDGIDGFRLSIGEYYRVPHREVIVVHERGICDEELPVVFFLAKRAHVHPDAIVRLRLRGMSWMDITLHYGLCPDIYYVPVKVVHHHHYHGHDYAYYRDHRHHDWRHMRLKDRDIVNQVNLIFISERHGYDPERVIRYRSEGRSFTRIDRDIERERHGRNTHYDRKDNSYRQDHRDYDKDRNDHWKKDRKESRREVNDGRSGRDHREAAKPFYVRAH